ncbi:hypothetical protein, partial [Neisseria gonorrhoeae]|uniref:hypothetical protein n=1 Tax=Neisseria gonorrhoeae TaxID=485 RepID=UPI001C5A3610
FSTNNQRVKNILHQFLRIYESVRLMKNGFNCFRTITQIWYYTLNIAVVNRKAEGALEYAVISVPIIVD